MTKSLKIKRNRYCNAAEIVVQGSKNGSLPCLAATLLHSGITILENVPMIEDVFTALDILKKLGACVWFEDNKVIVYVSSLNTTEIPPVYMRKMRSSIIFSGALIAKTGKASVVWPGGCVIGKRPIDYHIHAFRSMGFDVDENEEGIIINSSRLHGTNIKFANPSVGATENVILAACGVYGTTVIDNAAKEPEIIELVHMLKGMGYEIYGEGTSHIVHRGKKITNDSVYKISGDRIAAGTWLLCSMSSKCRLELSGAPVSNMKSTIEALLKTGADIKTDGYNIKINPPEIIKPISLIETSPYPGFPTDMQSQFLPVLSMASGDSRVVENIFSSRYKVVDELNKMGTDIDVSENKRKVIIKGNCKLKGGVVNAPDLRGGAALIIAAMGSEDSITIINNFYHVQRGYEFVEKNIAAMGGEICCIGLEDT